MVLPQYHSINGLLVLKTKTSYVFEVVVQIPFGFSMKLSIDLFQWYSSLTDYVTELHSSPQQKI